jgi:hypothetical protein
MKGHDVTLFINQRYMDGTEPNSLREYIQARVPCDAQLFVSNLLHIEFIALGTNRCTATSQTFDRMRCAIEEADTFMTDQFKSTLQQNAIDTLLVEAGMIAGQLAANALKIPVTALLDPGIYSDDLVLRKWVRLRPQSMRLHMDVWDDLDWANSFARYNKVRKRLGLPTLYAVSDIWSSVSLVLTKPRDAMNSQVSVVEGPLLTPCVPCALENPIDEYEHYDMRAILNVDAASTDYKLQKDLLKALSMARESGKAWVGSCKQGACPENFGDLYDFGVIQIGRSTEKYFPTFVAPLGNDIDILDTLGYVLSSGDEVGLILVDSKVFNINPWLNNMGLPFLEIDATLSIRELAGKILMRLCEANKPRLLVRTIKGLEPILSTLTDPTLGDDTRQADIDANYSVNFMVILFISCLFLALCASLKEMEDQGQSPFETKDHIIIGNQIRLHWSNTEEIVKYWRKWLIEQWVGKLDSKRDEGEQHPAPHRRRKTNKKKQA